MTEYIPVTCETKVFRGDYLKYFDEFEKCIGCGVLVRKVIDPIRPLTSSYYLMKDINTKKVWKVKCNRYKFFKKDHTSPYKTSDISELFFTEDILKDIKESIV